MNCECGCGLPVPPTRRLDRVPRFHQGHKGQVRSVGERLWPNVQVGGPDECWPWVGPSINPGGYGKLSVRDGFKKHHLTSAHRVAWEDMVGYIPEGLFVLHRCDNPPCCNPRHLFLGTKADNTHDMVAKGRARGRFST